MSTLVGYTYKAENYTPDGLRETLIAANIVRPDSPVPIEQTLNVWAMVLHIDREDLYSYDSDDFPKPIYSHQLDPRTELVGD